MDRKIKKLSKQIISLGEEEKKELLEFLIDEDEVEETEEVEEVEVTEEEKTETKETVETKKEVKPELVTLKKEDLEKIISDIVSNFVTKEEVAEVKEEVEKVTKKAKPFGVTQKKEKVDTTKQPTTQDYLVKLNSKFV